MSWQAVPMTDPRVAVITDVHADARALEGLFRGIGGAGIERIWCLGDFASGGSEPLEVYEAVMEACEVVLAGNHELFVTHRVWTRTTARWAEAARFAHERLGPERVEALRAMASRARLPHAELVHAALTDPAMDFIAGARAARRNLDLLRRPLLVFGHTHRAACWARQTLWARDEAIVLGERRALPPGEPRLLNPGAGCDARGVRWLELCLDEEERWAVWHRESVRGHGGVASMTPS